MINVARRIISREGQLHKGGLWIHRDFLLPFHPPFLHLSCRGGGGSGRVFGIAATTTTRATAAPAVGSTVGALAAAAAAAAAAASAAAAAAAAAAVSAANAASARRRKRRRKRRGRKERRGAGFVGRWELAAEGVGKASVATKRGKGKETWGELVDECKIV
jgi:hypothetical protein